MNATMALNQRDTMRATASRGGWLRWLIFAACVPLGVLIIGLVLIVVREFQATKELATKLNQLKQLGQPFDSASYDRWYREHTHSEGTQAWLQILDKVSTTSQLAAMKSLPIVGRGKEIGELAPETVWRDEPTVKDFLTEMQPFIEQIHGLKQWPVPVQLPVEIHGAQTLLHHYQQARSITRLLQLDFEYAFYHKEFDRALNDLRSIRTVAQAIDSNFCLVVELIVMATLGVQNQEIQRSLLTDSWPPEKLSELREIVGQARFTAAKWKTLFMNERAMFGDDVVAGDLSRIIGTKEASLVPLSQTGRLRIFESYEKLINIGNSPMESYTSTSKAMTQSIINRNALLDWDGANVWIGLMFPALESMAIAVENEESNRRLTLTAIALRQFKIQEGRWPNHLRELDKVGLSTNDFSTVSRNAFGYETENGVAYLWGGSVLGNAQISDDRPRDLDERTNGPTVVTLR